tara:strand:- start:858 stop:1046 length:189 start_codon:yes stop_codon:yes gene_type:complete
MLNPDATYKIRIITQVLNELSDQVGDEALGVLQQLGNVIDFGCNPLIDDCACEMCGDFVEGA